MQFVIVSLSIVTHPKFLGLDMAARGAWISLLCLAALEQPVRWQFRSRHHAELLLAREGAADAPTLVGRLIDVGLLDEHRDGPVEFHDHGDWQRYRSDMPEETRQRKRESRERKRGAGGGHGSSRDVTTREEEKSGEQKSGDKKRSEESTEEISSGSSLATGDHDFLPTLDGVSSLIARRWGRPLSEKQKPMIREIADRQGEGSKGFLRILSLLSAADVGDPVGYLKELDDRTKEAGRRRADAQEAESRRWRVERGSGSGPEAVGDILGQLAPVTRRE